MRDRLREHGIVLRRAGAGVRAAEEQLDRSGLAALLAQGLSVSQIAARAGYSRGGVYKLIRSKGLGAELTRAKRQRPADAREDQLVAEVGQLYAVHRLSLADIGARYGKGPAWARSRVIAAGVPLRGSGKPRAVEQALPAQSATAGVTAGEQVGAWPGRSADTPRPGGTPGRGGTPSLPPLDPAVLERLYVEQLRTIRQIAEQLQVSADRVGKGLRAAGIVRRPPGSRSGRPPLPVVTKQQLTELYVDRRLPVVGVAAELGVSAGWVSRQLQAHRIERRPRSPAAPAFDVNAATLHRLYVTEHLDDAVIAASFGVPTHRVVQRRRALGVHRALVPPPHPPRPAPPPAAELRRLYSEEHQTLAQIARRYHTASPQVGRWLRAAGVQVTPRTSRADRADVDAALLRELYQQREWSAPLIAAHLDTTVHLVLRALHDHGIPVRRGGAARRTPSPADEVRLLELLYDDPDVQALLRRHSVTAQPAAGSITERFPEPAALTAALLHDGYTELGMSARQLELLTGQPADQILDALHAHRIPVRRGGYASPWLRRQHRHLNP